MNIITPPDEHMPVYIRVRRDGASLVKFAERVNALQKESFGATVLKLIFTHDTANILRLRSNLRESFEPTLRNCEIMARVASDPNVYVIQTDRVMNRRTQLAFYIKRTDGTIAECVLFFTDDNVLEIVDIGYHC